MHRAALRSIFCLTAGGSLALAACAPKSSPTPPAPAAVVPRLVGEVAVIDEERKFVLIDLGSNLYVPPPGMKLRSRNASGETAQLKTSPEQKLPFIAADIVSGEPAVGDEVVQ